MHFKHKVLFISSSLIPSSPPLFFYFHLQLRDFISNSLYNPHHGYFSKQAPVGFLNPPIDFSTLPNRAAYFAEVQRRYTALQVAWLTPVEIFSPHFGASIARYLTTQHLATNTSTSTSISTISTTSNTKTPLVIYELGGGTGTLARDTLNWLKQYKPEVHATCQYTCIEISPTLADLQYKRVVVELEGVHERQFQVVRGDAADSKTWLNKENMLDRDSDEPCFVVAMEVLDNLPHDKVVYSDFSMRTGTEEGGGEGRQEQQWLETFIATAEEDLDNNISSTNSSYKEVYRLVSDPLIHRCLNTWLEMEENNQKTNFSSLPKHIFQKFIDVAVGGGGDFSTREIFLPTGALNLFDTLHKVRPNHRLVCADFDFLPETVISGKNAPLVATTVDGRTKDYGTYLVQPGVADIFFPSEFELLSRLYDQNKSSRGSAGAATSTRFLKSKDFFEKWVDGKERLTRCRDGYDPMLEDYSNTSFLIS